MLTRSQKAITDSQKSLMWRWTQDSIDIQEKDSSLLNLMRTKAFIICKSCMTEHNKYTDNCKYCNIKLSNRPIGLKYL